MVNFIQSADSKIKIIEDVSYLLNNALHVNAVFTATGAHAEINWYNTSSDHAPSAAATVKNTTSSVDGLHNITIQLGTDVAASQEYHIDGWIALP